MRIEVKNGLANFSVDLKLDLGLYCKIAKPLYRGLALPNQALPAEIAEALSTKEPVDLLSYEAGFQIVRQTLEDQLYELAGATQWADIEQLLIAQCESTPPLDKDSSSAEKLRKALSMETRPLAIQGMRNYFIELLKNSMDALVENYFIGKHESTALQMNVAVQILDEKIVVNVSDNAGGFSAEYKEHFSQQLLGEKKLWSSRKHKDKKYFFGGYGFGLSLLNEFVSRAADDGGSINKEAMLLENSDIGAEIIITSLLEPFTPSTDPLTNKRKQSSDLEQHNGGPQHLFFLRTELLPLHQAPLLQKREKRLTFDP